VTGLAQLGVCLPFLELKLTLDWHAKRTGGYQACFVRLVYQRGPDSVSQPLFYAER